MSRSKQQQKLQPFPLRRPQISIKPSRAKPFSVEFRELPGWFAVPEVGDQTLWSVYDPPNWTLTSVTEMVAVRPAQVHDVDCVEIEVNDWDPDKGWTLSEGLMYGRLTRKAAQWLATHRIVNGKRVLYTFLDEGFDEDWREMPRKLEDRGRFVLNSDGTLRQRKSRRCRAPGAIGAGIFRVKIGRRAFTCLRVLDTEKVNGPTEEGILAEYYVTRAGRTVLFRRYNGRQWGRIPGWPYAKNPPWDEFFPHHNRIVIDGVTFVHWYDCLSGLACGITNATVSL